jgi:hypothetical protein
MAVSDQVLTALQEGKLSLQGQFLNSSNYTFLGKVESDSAVYPVVYKPRKGEQELWDFPVGTLARREVAAFVVSEALGWDLVPPTVYRRRRAHFGAGSLQLYIEHNPDHHYFNFSESEKQRLKPVVLFDVIANNADRKGGHVFFDADDHLWVIDHGICFSVDEKLRTVIWDFAGQPIPPVLGRDLANFAGRLENEDELRQQLTGLLRVGEINAMLHRTHRMLEAGIFPLPAADRRPYPWPPI